MITKQIRVYGIVQGVGFRPTVSRHAMQHHICGYVCNKGPYVEMIAQGDASDVDAFITDVEKHSPKRSVILKMTVETLDNNDNTIQTYSQFDIIESAKTSGDIFISPDIAVCEACSQELFDPDNRRYLHPFINCTCCGPRLTILDALPYDRERTSMKDFPMCPNCHVEYTNPDSRRYDAQPVCCNDCGPELYLLNTGKASPTKDLSTDINADIKGEDNKHTLLKGLDALAYTRKIIAEGGIAAIKGIGGFHLCCDATNEAAVQRLRSLKHRPSKPFAIMARNIEAVRRICHITPQQADILTGHQKPIILLEKLSNSFTKLNKPFTICDAIAPGNPKIGVMLPYAPVQLLLFDYPEDDLKMPDYLVMTSGNVSGAPICRDDADAVEQIAQFCDCILSNDRKIRIRADDSVMDFYHDEPYMIRRSRGYAPLPYQISKNWQGSVLAVGGELKNTFCIGTNQLLYPSPYVGDLEDLRTVHALSETIERFETLLETKPQLVVCDLHPRYNSTVVAKAQQLPVLQVQHHYAHILSCMAENDYLEPVIGVSFDGTGYGEDGTIWGGEILTADLNGFKRLSHITPFLQVGGDASSREGWRIAVAMIDTVTKSHEATEAIVAQLGLCTPQACKMLLAMADRKINTVTSTSAGRLFDAVSALLGIRLHSTFEGEASTALQFCAEAYAANEKNVSSRNLKAKHNIGNSKDKNISNDIPIDIPTSELFGMLLQGRLHGDDIHKLAYEFHEQLASLITQSCIQIRLMQPEVQHPMSQQPQIQYHKQQQKPYPEQYQVQCLNTVALSGGVFQNRLLLELTETKLTNAGFKVLRHHLLPPNDGGICAGQALYGMHYLNINK